MTKGHRFPGLPWLFWWMLALSGVVLIEPAPTDYLLAILLISFLYKSKLIISPRATLPVTLLGLFAFANVVSMAFSVADGRSIAYFGITLFLMLLCMICYQIVIKYGINVAHFAFSGYTLAAVLTSVLGISAYFGLLSPELLHRTGRPAAFFKDPNVFGPFLVPIVVYSLMRIETLHGRLGAHRWVWLVVFCTCLAGVLLSFSRAAWINCVVAITVYLIVRLASGKTTAELRRYAWVLITLAFAAILGSYTLLQSTPVVELLSQRLGLQGYDSQRFGTQAKVFAYALQNPLGAGPGQTELLFERSVHSLYGRLLVENGVLGFLAFLGWYMLLVFRMLGASLSNANTATAPLATMLVGCLVGLLANSFVIDTLHWRHLWVLAGIAFGISDLRIRSSAGRTAA